MVLPPVTLLAWLNNQPVVHWLLPSLVLAPLLLVWAIYLIRGHSRIPRWVTLQYLGVCAVLLPFLLPASVATIFFNTQLVGLVTLAAWAVALLVGIYAVTKIREAPLTLVNPLLDKNYRLVHISDVHVGSRSKQFLHKVIDQVASHKPDAVMITGDLLDLSHVDQHHLEPLSRLQCPAYLCLGNHELYVDLEKAILAIETNGVKVLRNESAMLGKLQIHGVDDQNDKRHVHTVMNQQARLSDYYQILLYHRPDGWSAALENGIDLMLAGHTHAGQIWPFGLLVERQFEHIAGHYTKAGQHLYVSPGTGTWGPTMRLGTRSEMTIIDLVPHSL